MSSLATLHKNFIEYPLFTLGLLDNRLLRFGVFTATAAAILMMTKPAIVHDHKEDTYKPLGLVGVSLAAGGFSLLIA